MGISGLQGLCTWPQDLRRECLDEINDWGSDPGLLTGFVPIVAPKVELGIAPAGTPLSKVPMSEEAVLNPDGSFRGSLSADGLSSGEYTVVASACYGQETCGRRGTSVAI